MRGAAAVLIVAGAAILLVGFVIGAVAAGRGRRPLLCAVRILSHRIPWLCERREAAQRFFAELRAQGHVLVRGDPSRTVAMLLLTALQWLTRYGVLWLVLTVLGYPLPFGFVVLLQALILHLAQWSGVPAGGGSADLALAAAMAPWVPAPSIATALLLWRFATFHLGLIAGGASLVALAGVPAAGPGDVSCPR